MDLAISCHPPLGLATVVDTAHVRFTVGINSTSVQTQPKGRWDLAIWHNNCPNGAWAELPLTEINAQPHLPIGGENRAYYQARLRKAGPEVQGFGFTLKFRSPGASWQWVKDAWGFQDGYIVFKSSGQPSPKLGDYISSLSSDVSIQPRESATYRSWELTTSIPAAIERVSGRRDVKLGRPLEVVRWFALVRHSAPWLGPRHGRDRFDLNEDAILVSFMRLDGHHLVLLALSGIDDVLVTIKGDDEGRVVVECRNERPTAGTARLFAAVGPSWNATVAAVFDAAKAFTKSTHPTDQVSANAPEKIMVPDDRQMSAWRDGFTYCTWNGLGQNLTPAKIHGALDMLSSSGINISNLIIDDNWQSLDFSGDDNFYHRWTGFEANKENFPQGLKSLISQIRVDHPSIRNIAMWHGIFGYWGGMSTTGDISEIYSMRTFKRRVGIFLGGGEMSTVDGQDASRLFEDFYRFLVESGVNAVKTDTQSFLDYPEYADDRLALINPYQDAWRAAATKYFGGNIIACMAQVPQAIFRTFMRDDLPRIMMRNSDDFFPNEASAHSWHLFCNAHNAVLTEHLNVLPDWDMFQTDHDFSNFHGAARCLSGGPICITDVPGQHDLSLINRMTASTPDGRLVILRANKIGKASEVYNSHTEPRLLRIQTEHLGASIIGLFNVGTSTLTEFQSLKEFQNVLNTIPYIIHHHGSDNIVGPWTLEDDFTMVELSIPVHGFEILTAHPVYTFAETRVAVLGLLGKIVPGTAIIKCEYATRSSGIEIRVSMKALGTLGIYVLGPRFNANLLSITVGGYRVIDVERFISMEKFILRIHLDRLWEGLDLTSSECEKNPVDVTVLVP